jgi:hypothetical protein
MTHIMLSLPREPHLPALAEPFFAAASGAIE